MIPGSDAYFVVREGSRYGPYTREMLLRLEQLGYISWADRLEDNVGTACRFRDIAGQEVASQAELFGPVPPAVARILGMERPQTAPPPRLPPPSRQPSSEWMVQGSSDFQEEDGYDDERHEYEDDGDDFDGDALILRAKPSPWNFPLTMLLVLGVLTAGIWTYRDSPLWFAAACAVASLLLFVIEVRRASRVYLVTRNRVEAVTGLVARSSKEMRVADIKAIDVRKRGWRGLLNIGDVKFSSTGSGEEDVIFHGVSSPHRIKHRVRSLAGG